MRYLFLALGAAALLPAAEVTFTEHVAPIIFNHCSSCHRPGQAAPFSLLSYDDVARRARQIVGVTRARLMPPWKAEPGPFPFRDERRLSDEQIATLERWVQGGLVEGDPGALPEVPELPEGWRLGAPDLVVEMPETFRVRASGGDIYRNFTIPLALPENKWLRAIEFRSTARAAVHHVLFFSDNTGLARRLDAADPEPGFSDMTLLVRTPQLGGWALGQQPAAYPDGLALPLPRGSDLILQFHFSPTGRVEEEKATLGLYFADKQPERTLVDIHLPPLFGVLAGINIPPGATDFQVTDSFTLPVDVEAVTVRGHAHYLGKRLHLRADFPDGASAYLLEINDWDFAWQDYYFYRDLVPLPRGTRLTALVSWDNSADNPRNPNNPPIRVRWGERSADEMGSLILEVVPRRQQDLRALQQALDFHLFLSALRAPR